MKAISMMNTVASGQWSVASSLMHGSTLSLVPRQLPLQGAKASAPSRFVPKGAGLHGASGQPRAKSTERAKIGAGRIVKSSATLTVFKNKLNW